MRSAAVDVGSNTIRMLIGEVRGNSLSRLCTDRVVTRLAEGIGDSGTLREENMKRSVSVLRSFSLIFREYGAMRIGAVGTSALREALNSRDFLDEVFQETGTKIEIISGAKEAELTSKGVLLGFREPLAPSLIIDIGGGSTEWISFDPERTGTPSYGSLDLGVIKLLERFIRADPPSELDLKALEKEIETQLPKVGLAGKKYTSGSRAVRLVGTGGTITTLASLDLGLATYDPSRIHMHKTDIGRLYKLKDMLVRLPLSRRMKVDGLDPGRADLIIPGILLTIKLMEFFGFQEIIASDYGLLEGLLKEMSE